jgi:hypothetical protein
MKEKLETLKSALTNIKTNINEIRSRTSMSPNNTDLSQNGTSTYARETGGQQQAQQSQLEHKHQQLFRDHSGFTDDSQLVNTSGIIGAPPNAKSFDGGYRSSTSTIHQSMLENSNILMNTSGASIIPRKPRNSSRASYKHLKDAAAEPEMPAH